MRRATIRRVAFFAVGFLAGVSLRQDSISTVLSLLALFVVAILGLSYLRSGISHAREVLRILRKS